MKRMLCAFFTGLLITIAVNAHSEEVNFKLLFFNNTTDGCMLSEWAPASEYLTRLCSFESCPATVFWSDADSKTLYAVLREDSHNYAQRGDPIYGETVHEIKGDIRKITLEPEVVVAQLTEITSTHSWHTVDYKLNLWNPNANMPILPPKNPFEKSRGKAEFINNAWVLRDGKNSEYEGWFYKRFNFNGDETILLYKVGFGDTPHIMELRMQKGVGKNTTSLTPPDRQYAAKIFDKYVLLYTEYVGEDARLIDIETGNEVLSGNMLFPMWFRSQ